MQWSVPPGPLPSVPLSYRMGEGSGGQRARTWVTDRAKTWVTLSAFFNEISYGEQELVHTSAQALKGNKKGVCDEVGTCSAWLANTRSDPSRRGESVTHVLAQSVTHVLAPCR